MWGRLDAACFGGDVEETVVRLFAVQVLRVGVLLVQDPLWEAGVWGDGPRARHCHAQDVLLEMLVCYYGTLFF